VLDGYLREDEGKLRQLRTNALLEMIVRVLWVFWRV
jgi:hypothetical protein